MQGTQICGPWWQHDPQTATWPQVSAQPLWHLHSLWWQQATDINYDRDCGGITEQNIVPGSSPGLDVTMAPGDSTGNSDWGSP